MDAHDALRYVAEYGNAATFVGVLLEGEMVLLVAGIAVALGYVDPRAVAASAVLAAMLSDNFFFVLGRRVGPIVLARFPTMARTSGKIVRLVERYPSACVLAMRFLYGTRTIGPAVIGAGRITWTRWLVLDGVAACMWTLTWILAGMVSGGTLRALVDASPAQVGSFIAIAVAVAVIVVMKIARSVCGRRRVGARSGTLRSSKTNTDLPNPCRVLSRSCNDRWLPCAPSRSG